MKKQVLFRAFIGAPWGLAIGMAMLAIMSVQSGTGELTVASAALVNSVGGEINAFVLQCLATMLYGSVWAAASVVWDAEWSLLRQTLTHLVCCAASALPIAWLMQWMAHTWQGFLQYLLIFAGAYAVIWAVQYLQMRRRVRAMNARLKTQ